MITFKIIALIAYATLAGIYYRVGGMDAPYNRYYRRLGVPAIVLITLHFLQPTLPWWVYLSVFALQFGTLTTYFKFGKQDDVVWYNWVLTGFFCGLAMLPIVFSGYSWTWFLARCGVISGVYVLVSEVSDNVWVEELARGAVLVATLPILFL